MTIEEIYNYPEIKKAEEELVRIFTRYAPIDSPYGLCTFNEEGKEIVESLFNKRKKILDDMFAMDKEYKRLLQDFNEALKMELMDIRNKSIKAYNAAITINPEAEVNAKAKCYLGCTYPKLHPIQTQRAKQIWAILNGSCGCLDLRYKDGVLGFGYDYYGQEERRDDYILYPIKEFTNWNEGLDPIMTQDMHLVYAFHHLYHRCKFSIFDLLWVRDFTSEITVSIDSHKRDLANSLEQFQKNE